MTGSVQSVRSQNGSRTLMITVVIAAIGSVTAGVASIVGPLALASQSYARQDEVAAQLKEIHGLVNSQLTRAMKNELEAMMRERAMLLELVELKKFNGLAPTDAVLETLATSADLIIKLRREISDRERQQALIDTQ